MVLCCIIKKVMQYLADMANARHIEQTRNFTYILELLLSSCKIKLKMITSTLVLFYVSHGLKIGVWKICCFSYSEINFKPLVHLLFKSNSGRKGRLNKQLEDISNLFAFEYQWFLKIFLKSQMLLGN